MSTLPSSIEVAIVGAGAAGIAAATRLKQAGVSALMIEARDRVGGRAHTIPAAGDVIDLGCEWLHSADKNVLVKVAEAHGFTVDKGTPGWSGPASVGLPSRDHAEYRKALEDFFDAVEEAAAAGKEGAASDLLPKNSRWEMLLRAVATYYSGTELEKISIIDFDNYEDTRINWTVREGYGAMITGAAKGLPVVFDCAVTKIDHAGKAVKLETKQGTIEAKAVIVCAPTPLIAEGTIRFDPALPDKQAAAAGLLPGTPRMPRPSLPASSDPSPRCRNATRLTCTAIARTISASALSEAVRSAASSGWLPKPAGMGTGDQRLAAMFPARPST